MLLYDCDPKEGAWDAAFDGFDAVQWTGANRPIPVCSPIFQWLAFPPPATIHTINIPADVQLRATDSSSLRNSDLLIAHPVATRSFATFPSVRRMRFHYHSITYGTKANDLSGVTVWYVLRSNKSE